MKVNSVKKIEECKIVISDNKQLFDKLENLRYEIEEELGFNLDWDRKTGVESHITYQRDLTLEMKMNGMIQFHGI